jgi:hypothetical protein
VLLLGLCVCARAPFLCAALVFLFHAVMYFAYIDSIRAVSSCTSRHTHTQHTLSLLHISCSALKLLSLIRPRERWKRVFVLLLRSVRRRQKERHLVVYWKLNVRSAIAFAIFYPDRKGLLIEEASCWKEYATQIEFLLVCFVWIATAWELLCKCVLRNITFRVNSTGVIEKCIWNCWQWVVDCIC